MKKLLRTLLLVISIVGFSQSTVPGPVIVHTTSGTLVHGTAYTVDAYSAFRIRTTTSSLAFTIPNPTNADANKTLLIVNDSINGSVQFSVTPGGVIPVNGWRQYRWSGTLWLPQSNHPNIGAATATSLKVGNLTAGLIKSDASGNLLNATAGSDYLGYTGTTTYVPYFSTANAVTSEAAFNYNESTNTLATDNAVIPTVYGSTSSAGNLQLHSTSNATKGFIYLGDSSAYDATALSLGIGTRTPVTSGRVIQVHNPLTLGTAADNASFIAYSQNRNAVFNSRTAITGTSAFQHQSLDGLTVYGQMLFFDAGSSLHQWSLNVDGNQRILCSSDGRITLGLATSTATNVTASKNITGSTVGIGYYQKGVVQSDVTGAAYGYRNDLGTQATSFTCTEYNHFFANQPALGAGSVLTTQYGFRVNSNLTSATTNYGFYGDIASGTNRYNLYMGGSADNYLSGKLGIGVVPASTVNLFVILS